jgi:hypothetical protein
MVALDGRCAVPVVRTVIGWRQFFTTPIRAGKLKNWKSEKLTSRPAKLAHQIFRFSPTSDAPLKF